LVIKKITYLGKQPTERKMNWLIIWIVIYLVLLIVLSLRHVKSTDMEQYLVNNRATKTLPLVATTMATFVGGGASIGLMAMGYESGFAAIAIGIAHIIGFFIISKFAGKIRDFGAQHKIYSLPHYLNFIFGNPKRPGFSSFFAKTISGVNIFIFFFMVAAQFVAMASLLKFSFEIGYNLAAAISAIIVIIYTAVAGLSGVIITDMIQFSAIVLMIILIFVPGIWADTEQLTKLADLPDEMLYGTSYGIVFILALPIFFSWSVLVRMDIWQRLLAAKSAKVARRVTLWAAAGMLPFYLIFPLTGMAILFTMGEGIDPKDVAYHFINRHTDSIGFIYGFAIVGLLSALMSSGDSFLNIISISAVKDFKKANAKEPLTNKDYRWMKYITVIFGAIALVMALVFPNIVDLMVVSLSTITIFAPLTLFALIRKDAGKYRKAALASLISGFTVNLFFFIYGLTFPDQFEAKSSFVPGVIVATLFLLIGMRFWKHDE
jgi:Na+/proline symporter